MIYCEFSAFNMGRGEGQFRTSECLQFKLTYTLFRDMHQNKII